MTTPKLPSRRSSAFRKLYEQLPDIVRQEADETYKRFKADSDHPGLHFKQIVGVYYSVRIGDGHRALAQLQGDHWLWFWIGAHARYDHILDQLRRGKRGV